jgi:F0F1-type ATP synthase assembly protein I
MSSPAFGLIGIGFFLATSIVGMTVIGNLLDRQFGTDPVLTLVFLVLGLMAGFLGAYRQLTWLVERSSREQGRGR